ncbi:MAG: hypothetical protein GY925_16810, partial [Actinomycetia bacterium]|nr:hypothetical protein [Actinomycetes bacterium]
MSYRLLAWSSRFTLQSWSAVAALIVVASISALLMSGPASAQIELDITVTPSTSASDAITLDGATFNDVSGDVSGIVNGDNVTVELPQPELTGLPDITASNGESFVDTGALSIGFIGDMSFLAADNTALSGVRLLVTATWEDADTDTTPSVAVLVGLGNPTNPFSLSDLNSGWADVGVTSAILGTSNEEYELAPFGGTAIEDFFSDGLTATDDGLTLSGGGLDFQIAGADLVTAGNELGLDEAGVRLQGTVTTTSGLVSLNGVSSLDVEGIDVTASVAFSTPASFPDWIELGSPWDFSVSATTAGDFSVGIAGDADVDVEGGSNPTTNFAAEVVVTYDAGNPSLDLAVTIGEITDLFDQSWLTMTGAELGATIASGAFAGSFSASLELGEITTDIEFSLEVDGSDVSAAATIVADNPNGVSVGAILVDVVGASKVGELEDALSSLVINGFSAAFEINKSGSDPAEVFLSVFGSASLDIGEIDPQPTASMLFQASIGGGGTELLGAAQLSGINLAELDSTFEAFDWTLPEVAVVASTGAIGPIPFDDLDVPTATYFESILCDENDECSDLEVIEGVEIISSVDIPDEVSDQLEEIGIAGEGPIVLSGTIPLFGNDDPIEVTIDLPDVVDTTGDSLVASGGVDIVFSIDPGSLEFGASIEGNLVFRITRPDQDNCDGSDGTFATGGDCYDELTLEVAASITANATSGEISIELSASILEWDNAFGFDWLTIKQFTIRIGLTGGGTGGVSVDVGLLGSVVLDDTFDLFMSVSVSFTANAPWIVVNGFTAGTESGISIGQIGDLFDLDTSALPDLSVRNLWFAWGVEDDEDLCIRQGLFFSGELHLNADAPDSDGVTCPDDNPLPASADDLSTDSCDASPTCLAAVIIDINPSDPSFTVAGFITGFEAGPIEFDATTVLIQVSPTVQRFALSGGATLSDPTGLTGGEWASGTVDIELSNDNGLVLISVEATVDLADGGFEAYVHGSISADFSTIGSGGIIEWFDSFEFDLDVELSFPGLEKLGEDVLEGLEDTAEFAEDAWNETEEFFDDAGTDLAAAAGDVEDFFDDINPFDSNTKNIDSIVSAITGADGTLDKKVVDTFNEIVSYVGKSAANTVLGDVAQQITDAGGIDGIALYGATIDIYGGWRECAFGYCAQIIPKVSATFDGYCNGTSVNNPICVGTGGDNSLSAQEMADKGIEPAVRSQLDTLSGLNLDAGTGDALDTIEALEEKFDDNILIAECLAFDVVYNETGTGNDSQGLASLGLDVLGVDSGLDSLDMSTIGFTDPNGQLSQDSLDNVIATTPDPTTCSAPTAPPNAGGATLRITSDGINVVNEINEGDTVFANGFIGPAFSGETLTLDWGDGTTEELEAIEGGFWSSSHTYLDDEGEGPANNYIITIKTETATMVRAERLTVNNLDPVLANVAVIPTTIDEGGAVTLSGDFSDAGVLDTHDLLVDWGDGSEEVVDFAFGVFSFSLSHSYPDDNPPLTASDDYDIELVLVDKDTGEDSAAVTVTVTNVPPTDPVVDSITVGGTPVDTEPDGTPIIPAETEVTYTWTSTDPGLDDDVYVVIDWGDGTFLTGADVTRIGETLTITTTHTYTNPTIPEYTLTIKVIDDDDAEFTITQDVVIEGGTGPGYACYLEGDGGISWEAFLIGDADALEWEVWVLDSNGDPDTMLDSFAPPARSVALQLGIGDDQTITLRPWLDSEAHGEFVPCGEVDVAAIEVTKTPDATQLNEPGADVTFTVDIVNQNQDLSVTIDTLDDTVFGDLDGEGDCSLPQTIPPGGSYECSFTEEITGPGGFVHTNIVTASGVDEDDNPVSDSDDAEVEILDSPSAIEVIKTADPETVTEPGGDVTFTFVVNNLSVADAVTIDTLDDSIYGDLDGQGDCSVPQSLAALGSYECSITVYVSGGPGDLETNVVTAAGEDDDGNPLSDTDDATVTVIGSPSVISVDKTASQLEVFAPGEDVTFTVVVSNYSTIDTVTIDSLVDDIHGDLNGQGDCAVPFDLVPGDSSTCSFSAFVDGTETDIVTASGVDDDDDPVSAEDDATVTLIAPAIEIEKSTNGEDADDPTGPEIAAGSNVTWNYAVTNTGDTLLTNLNVVDDQGVTVDCPQTGLSALATITCTGTGVAELGQYANVGAVTATATDTDGDTKVVTDNDPSHYLGVDQVVTGIKIEKATNGVDADIPTGPIVPVGDPVTWTYVVTNTGNTRIFVEFVVDDGGGSDDFRPAFVDGDADGDGLLDPTETWTYEASSTAVEGQYTNIGTVVGVPLDDEGDPIGDIVGHDDPSSYFGVVPDVPAIDIEKATNGVDADDPTGPLVPVGDAVAWTYVVTNSGNVDLAEVSV